MEKLKKCLICHNEKPLWRFNSPADSTCKICRRLMDSKIIVSSRVAVSQNAFFGGQERVKCVTCKNEFAQDEFPLNSYECRYCNNLRHYMEKCRIEEVPLEIVCSVCSKVKDVKSFPYGTFICKTCIAKTNRYKRRVE